MIGSHYSLKRHLWGALQDRESRQQNSPKTHGALKILKNRRVEDHGGPAETSVPSKKKLCP